MYPELERPIRVMELRSTYRWGGGPDKTILTSAALHDSAKIETLIVYLRSHWDHEFVLAERGRNMGLNVIELVEKHVIDFSTLKKIIEITRKYQIDIIHSRDYKANLFALLIRTFFNRSIRIITTAHGWVGKQFKLAFYYSMDKILASFFDRNLVLFKNQVKLFIRKPNQKTTLVVHNGIDYKAWDPRSITRGSFRSEMSVSASTTLVGFVGRIMPEKDILSLVSVANEIINARKREALFVCVGESKSPHYERAVRTRIRTCKLEGKFRLLGARFDLKQVYRDLDIFIMTSIQEGFPNSLLEAMAMKVPSIVSGVDGIPEILEDRVHGIILGPGDVNGFADAVEELVDNKDLAEALVVNSRRKVESELSFEYRLKKMEKIYVDLFAEMNKSRMCGLVVPRQKND
jgi:glycosyltransferase involved in cell wall biosynthesis